jgi:hypothetical protein
MVGGKAYSQIENVPILCAYGLIAELVTAGAGYIVCNVFWPNFNFNAAPEEFVRGSYRRESA